LFDAGESVRLDKLSHSTYPPLAETATKLRKEEIYHLRHTRAWVERLGLGTEESHHRLQDALNQLWGPAQDLFRVNPEEEALAETRIVPASQELVADWEAYVRPFLESCELVIPARSEPSSQPRLQHTPYLKTLLAELQSLPTMDPEAEW
jgi:ring-1,2-phenylacetyl-CoA epoxidase subunit PaaC